MEGSATPTNELSIKATLVVRMAMISVHLSSR
jgi:hypothetical protein